MSDYPAFGKIPRLRREVIVTEKIDGSNGLIHIDIASGTVLAGSRKRWLDTTKSGDNFGFAKWVHEHAADLVYILGDGLHYGEWWGSGIQRGYGLTDGERRFSLFNTSRWKDEAEVLGQAVPGLGAVPVLTAGEQGEAVDGAMAHLRFNGSQAAPGFMNPEGVVVWHTAARQYFKVLLENDEFPKAAVA